jgi:hypothetical protein
LQQVAVVASVAALDCAHAARYSEGGQYGGQDDDDCLNDEFPSFFVHGL